MSLATSSLLIAIRLGQNALDNTKRYPLTNYEKNILKYAGYNKATDSDILSQEIYVKIDQLLLDNKAQ
ncbi:MULTISPECIES: hypothetical protein [Prochlorococcus]|uniref:hypothetical protein n=1 Tax=Prochlorococcus TaxID=1218 RepID=UPI000533A8F8|nr:MULTISPECIES: hypothetical protein [Prochlorococcus]KGG12523.1 hypothetical protein EV05_1735 [Prochlorococcus sp. MIT 0601]